MQMKQKIGMVGETMAADFLAQKGYEILFKNWRYKNWEVDIIALQNHKIHFIEVKTRTGNQFGLPEEAITPTKMNALKKAAEAFLQMHQQYKLMQFDVIAIQLNKNQLQDLCFIEDVFF